MTSDALQAWRQFKADHPVGSPVTGTVVQAARFGVFVDLGVPYTALLHLPKIAPKALRKQFPDDYPKVGENITAYIDGFGDDVSPDGAGKVSLTQEPAAAGAR